MTARELQGCLDSLPSDIRRELEEIRQTGRGPFGRSRTQQIVAAHLDLLLRLRNEYGATHADLVGLLGLCGITGPKGAALTAATLSSAISRACARSDARAPKPRVRTARHDRAGAPAPGRPPPRGRAGAGDPEPAAALASQSSLPRNLAPNDIDGVFGTKAPPSGRQAPEVRRSDHKERLIQLLAQASMED